MDFKETQKAVHANVVAKGFYENPTTVGERLMLVVSELSEALEADRNGIYCLSTPESFKEELVIYEDYSKVFKDQIKDTFEDELADAVIRIMDMAEHMHIDLAWHIEQKMKYNSLREYKHGKAY